jgi:hypothetical protein
VAALAVVAMALRPKGVDDTTSISAIRHHPERFDGQAVKIRGKVGEVFIVGGGYAFYLHQGRDTMVVFTRSRVPVRSEHVTIARCSKRRTEAPPSPLPPRASNSAPSVPQHGPAAGLARRTSNRQRCRAIWAKRSTAASETIL